MKFRCADSMIRCLYYSKISEEEKEKLKEQYGITGEETEEELPAEYKMQRDELTRYGEPQHQVIADAKKLIEESRKKNGEESEKNILLYALGKAASTYDSKGADIIADELKRLQIKEEIAKDQKLVEEQKRLEKLQNELKEKIEAEKFGDIEKIDKKINKIKRKFVDKIKEKTGYSDIKADQYEEFMNKKLISDADQKILEKTIDGQNKRILEKEKELRDKLDSIGIKKDDDLGGEIKRTEAKIKEIETFSKDKKKEKEEEKEKIKNEEKKIQEEREKLSDKEKEKFVEKTVENKKNQCYHGNVLSTAKRYTMPKIN